MNIPKSKIQKMICLLVAASIVITVVSVSAGTTVSARYVKPRGSLIKWKIRIPEPEPVAVIVTQYIIPGSEILESSHPLNSYDKSQGIAKWLLSPVNSGTLRMEMRVSKPIRQKGEIRGEVQFQNASKDITSSIFIRGRAPRKALEGC